MNTVVGTERPAYVISTLDVQGRQTVLTEQCYLYHTGPQREPKDAETRIKILPKVPRVLRQPRLVLPDTSHPGHLRYIDIDADVDVSSHVLAIVIVVDPGKDPQEIVTWMVNRKLNGLTLSGGVVYDSHDPKA